MENEIFAGKTEEEIYLENKGLIAKEICRILETDRGALVRSEYDDLEQEGAIGLLNAIRTFDEQKNVCFSSYATICIHRSIRKHCFEVRYGIRVPESIQRKAMSCGPNATEELAKKYTTIPSGSNDICIARQHELSRSAESLALSKVEFAEALEKIGSKRWKNIILSYKESMDEKKVAFEFGVSTRTVKRVLNRFAEIITEMRGEA